MEPLDAARNDEGIGSSRRRISSILKAPRRSIRFPEAEQQEHVVECAKPVEKRNSRRVSFAPANDVLLFSKDVKNTSPAPGPLQDIITTAAMQNRAQVAVTEDQQVMGMETLLNAPLHTFQHREKVNFDFGDVEKTSLFSPDDAFMDMTYSHTMNIGNDADNSFLNCDSSPARGAKRERATLNDGEKTASCLDPEFQNFVASLSKPSGPSLSPVTTRARPATDAFSEETSRSLVQIKTQRANVDKENQAPSSVSAVMEKSLNPSRKTGELSHRSAHCPEDDSRMDMTECHTQAFTDDDDPFQCLFPTQEMYSSIDNKASQMAEKTTQQQTIKTQTSFNPKDMTSLKNPSLHASHQRHKVNLVTKDESRDKTAVFTAGDEFMDMTQSDMVNTARCSVDPPNQSLRKHDTCVASRSSVTDLDLGFKNFLSSLCKPSVPSGDPAGMVPSTAAPPMETTNSSRSLSQLKSDAGEESLWQNPTRSSGESFIGGTICPESDVSIDMTEAHTGRIIVLTSSDNAFQVLSPNQDNRHCESVKKQEMTSGQKNSEVLRSSNHSGLETSLKTKVQRNPAKFDPEEDCRDKTVRFSADDASVPAAAQPYYSSGDSSNGHTVCPGDDVRMDLTEALTGCILGITGAADNPHLLTQEKYPHSGSLKKVGMTSLGSSNCKGMDTALTASLKTKVERQQVTFDDNDCREKTVRFTADDAAMDVTRSHTVNIGAEFKLQSHISPDNLPACGEKTLRFAADYACMDVTRSHTVKIDADFEQQSHNNLDNLPACGEKTVRFSANDAAMDVTRSHTVNIGAEFKLQSHISPDNLPTCGEKTVRFSANDAAMDVTRSHTVNIGAEFEQQSHNNLDYLPACGEKTVRFTADDACMDVTRSHTMSIDSNSVLESLLPHRDSDILSTQENMDYPLSAKKTGRPCRNRSSSALTLDPGIKNSLSRKSGLWSNPVIIKAVAPAAPSPQKSVDADAFLHQLKTETPDVDTVSAVMEKSVNKTMTGCLENMDMTEGQTGHILEETYVDEPPQSLSFTQDSKKTELTSHQSNEALGSSSPDSMEIQNLPDSPDSNETNTRNEPQPRNHTCSLSQKTEQLLTGVDVDAQLSQRSRRMSLANLQSKVRRLSHLINTAPDTAAMDSRTAPLPSLERDMDKTSDNKTQSHPPVTEPEHEMGLVKPEEDTQAPSQPSPLPTTPFNLKTKQLMSRLSVGNFKAKLPQRSKPDDPKKTNYAGEHTRTVTVSVTNQLSNFDDLSNIYNEELGSCEDLSETLDVNPQEDKVRAAHEFNRDELMEDNGCEQDFISTAHGKKRPLPAEEVDMEDEKRIKTSTEVTSDVETFGLVECNSNMSTAGSSTTQTTDYSNSSRCEATFESTLKQSMFESQLEDYNNDLQRKLDDGTMTVSEFFKLFNIDFVIHNPRQSILPGRRMSDADRTQMDVLKDRHIKRPKQMVYETDVLHLTEVVEGLKERMQDLDKPLKTVNLTLWEEVRNSSGQELKSFGAKLKERNNFVRKLSKAREEQQRLTGKIEEADEMIKSLDDCIRGLEAELAPVEEKGFEDKPSLRTLQEEMQKVTEALASNERQTAELEMQKEQSLNKVKRLRAETRDLESHIAALNLVNEWKLAEKTYDGTVFTFLHETLRLELVYDKSNGNDADNQSERKISHIALKLQLDDEKSQGHACLVHKLLSQFFEGTNDWVEKYPTRGHVPKLLHDVGLVVSRCRLLGEELRLLKMWGGLRLDILSISCVDTQVHIIFSSLKTFSKFELIFSVTLIDRLYVLQMHSFKNMIGDTKIQQIEEIVASFRPGKNLLTKIMKKIHERLLC